MAVGAELVFGRFTLVDQLGQGGMGEIWLARSSGTLCVVKRIRAEAADDPDAIRRFSDEARLALLLAHPRICRVIDAGRIEGMHYLALEVVEGIDLLTMMARALEQNIAIDDGVALWIGACALDALSFAHNARHPLSGQALGVVHRDISPQNIMCAADGSARVIDFGLALSTMKRAQTEKDVVLGKIAYMSPEQATGGQVDKRTDIFALGVVLYELLTRARFWGDLELRQIWMQVGSRDYVPSKLSSLAPDIAAVLRTMIERDQSKRPGDAGELRYALAKLLSQRGGAPAASNRLAELVRKLAQPELERVARARPTVAGNVPTDSTALPSAPSASSDETRPDTESLAALEADAIAAAVASTKTLALPQFTALLADADVVNVVAIKPALVARPKPVTQAPAAPAPAPARPSQRRAILLAAAGAFAALVVAAIAAYALDLVARDPPVPLAPPPHVPLPVPPVQHPAPVDAGVRAPVVVVVDAGVAATAVDPLTADYWRVQQCVDPCAVPWKTRSLHNIRALGVAEQRAVAHTLHNCVARCSR